jgi:hypothetical protein
MFHHVSSRFILHIPRLASGGSSMINISMPQATTSPTVYASYDQGSSNSSVHRKVSDSPMFLPVALSSVFADIAFVYIYLHRKINGSIDGKYLIWKIKIDLGGVRELFTRNPFDTTTLVDKIYSFKLWDRYSYRLKNEILKGEYSRTERFYEKIRIRDNDLQTKLLDLVRDRDSLMERNDEISQLAQEIITEFPWDSYVSGLAKNQPDLSLGSILTKARSIFRIGIIGVLNPVVLAIVIVYLVGPIET